MDGIKSFFTPVGEFLTRIINSVYAFFNDDMFSIPLPGGKSLGLSLLVVMLVGMGIYFTVRSRFMGVRMLPAMVKTAAEKKPKSEKGAISGWQSLIVSTATRVGMGNLVGVVAAVSAGGAGAVFWMWITALLGSATAFVEAVLAQKYKKEDPIYGGYKGGPAYYIHELAERVNGRKLKRSFIAILFAFSGLLCWGGISQVIGNSVSDTFDIAFGVDPLISTVILVAVAAVVVLRKKATVKVLDIMVPIMAGFYFIITLVIIFKNITELPGIFGRIFAEAFGLRQAVAGGLGFVLANGIRRGLFSNEAGSGSAPCAAAAAESDSIAKIGLLQSLGVFIDTIIICSCTAFIMLLVPGGAAGASQGMALLIDAMRYHLGEFGVYFIAITLWLFSFSTFAGVLFYARSNVSYIFGDRKSWQLVYKIVALVMLFIGGLAAYTTVWTLGDVGIALMTVFNMMAILPLGGEAMRVLRDYEKERKLLKKNKK